MVQRLRGRAAGSDGTTIVVTADLREADAVLEKLATLIDFDQPAA